ncbi:two-component system, NarL family, invasion response regulator UvrY [Methylomarinovum caldicuralii]|uniref:Two-component system, NarL family, invasion response regulator UvrY n=1 Tax=Methylomarinovum caldicuralii TaxID=438856 RepID=A0AAU9BXY6_9GAMM|nr:response regulator [Methylomarinovum caldicuralii]BCX80897.1 two-component system, NarL family, invasion response regulator UvrY [Methylomarinovum caldicuralii]
MIKVIVADDHELVRSGIEHILGEDPEIQIVGSAATGEELLRQVGEKTPDVVIVDVNMPGMGGVEACRRIRSRHPDVRIIALSVYTGGPIPRHLLETGIDGYLSKHCPPQEMIQAVKSVYRGKRYLSADVATHLALENADGQPSPFTRLSKREMEVTLLTLQGKSIQEIADLLSVSPKTICTYRYRIFEKLGIRNDVELTRLAAKYGLLNGNGG